MMSLRKDDGDPVSLVIAVHVAVVVLFLENEFYPRIFFFLNKIMQSINLFYIWYG